MKHPFNEVLNTGTEYFLNPGKEDEIRGVVVYDRIDPATIPTGYHVYEIRHDDTGSPCTIEKRVWVDFYGSFITQQEIAFPEGEISVIIDEENFN